MAFAVFSHASYFLASQEVRGEQREMRIAAAAPITSRPLSRILGERAVLEAELARFAAAVCVTDCSALRRKTTLLRGRIEALTQEAEEFKQLQSATRSAQLSRERARKDPAIEALSEWISIPFQRMQLGLGVLVGLLLDCVGCVSWALLLSRPRALPPVTISLQPNESRTEPADVTPASYPEPVTARQGKPRLDHEEKLEAMLAQAKAALTSGQVKTTVRGLREHFKCGQEIAAELSRALKRPT
jgi:hypothetical protein